MKTFRITLLATLTFIIIVALFACAQTKALDRGKTGKAFMADTAVFVIFNDSSKINLSSAELSQIDSILQQCINEINLKQNKYVEQLSKKHPKHKLVDTSYYVHISEYKRQYVPYINKKEEKVVWVNCFCDAWRRDWKKELIHVEDGGSCYFNVAINLTTGKYEHLQVNGVA